MKDNFDEFEETEPDIAEWKELLLEARKLITNPEMVMSSDAVAKRYLIKMSAWGEYISELAGIAEAEYRTSFAEKYEYYKSIGAGTNQDCSQKAELAIKKERRNREILTRVNDAVINMIHSLRTLVK